MNIQSLTYFGPQVSLSVIGKPYVFRAPKYQGLQKNISDRNIQLLSSHLDKKVIIPNQNHGSDVVVLDDHNKSLVPESDAIITQLRDVCICVIASDCVPVFLYDEQTQSIGVVHAGRKGLEGGIISKSVLSMNTSFGAKGHSIQAYIGACISQENYELGIKEVEFFQQNYPSCVKKSLNNLDRYLLNVGAIAFRQLQELGVTTENITFSGECTYTESEKYHSYRRNTHSPESDYGNNIFGISLN